MACDSLNDRELARLFPGDSELATQMRALDWSQTPLGAVTTWPQSLCASVNICLQSRFPMLIMWGRESVMLYNDAYRPILGSRKHPYALGQRAQECWWETWQVIEPMLDGVLTQGEASWFEDALFSLDRNGYLEECYFTFSHSPILDETGNVGGVFTVVTETTQRVLSERRLSTLSELAAQTAGLTTVAAACAASVAVLAKNPDDPSFVLLYSVAPATGQASLTVAIGLTPGTALSPLEVNCADSDTDLSRRFKQVLETGRSQPFDLTEQIDWSSQSLELIPTIAVAIPVTRTPQAGLAHICVVGISPRRVLDRDYQNFCELLAGQLGTAISTARSLEEGRKRTIALAELDRAKTVFFSNVSHEFRTPLTLMLGPLEELSNSLTERLQPAEREQLQLIQRNGIRLQKLVNTLLDFARIEAGRIQASYEPTDLATYTVELASMFRSLIERAEMKLEIDCPPLPVPVYVDRQMWEKIVFNLISNAFKFTFSGTIAVRLQAVGDAIELSVRDTGVGIPTAELPRLFERFYRVSGTRSRTYEGSGIGLAFVKRLVELHQGSIDVTSVEVVGTCFTITLPTGTAHLPPERIGATRTLISTAVGANAYIEEAANWVSSDTTTTRLADVSPELIVQSSIQPVLDPQPARTARILIADDNADLRDYLRRLLSPQYQVVVVTDGVEALAAIRQQLPDLVLADVMMPNLDGLGLLQALRSDPHIREIPMILLSARAGEEARIEGLAAGADDYITKPFSARELLVRVELTLKLTQMRREATQREQAVRLEAEIAKARVETILASIRDGFLVLDLDWCFTYVNDNFCELAGMSRAEILGRNIWELFPPAVENELYVHSHQAMRDGTPIQFESLYLAWQRWYEFRLYPSPSSLTIFVADITERKIAEQISQCAAKLDAFRITLTNALRPIADPVEIQVTASRVLGEHLDANRVAYFEVNDGNYVVERDYINGATAISGSYSVDSFGEELLAAFRSGQAVSECDVAADLDLSPAEKSGYAAIEVGAYIGVPLVKGGKFIAGLAVHSIAPRVWTPDDVTLVEEVAKQTWAALERARTEAALRESEVKYRTLFESMDEGYVLMEMLFDATEHPIDFCYLDANPAAIRMLGGNPTGRHVWEVNPQLEAHWLETLGRVAQTGIGERHELEAPSFGTWYNFYVFKIGNADSRQVAVIFEDVTIRKRREANLAFLTEIQDEFTHLVSADEIMQAVGEKIGAYLNISQCVFGEIDRSQDWVTIKYDWHNLELPDLIGVYQISDFVSEEFLQAAQAGETIVINNTQADARTDADRYAAFNIHAFAIVPFHRGNEWKYLLTINDSRARQWREDEIELIFELANRIFPRLERARAEAVVADNLRDTRLLRDLSARLVTEDDTQTLYREILATAIALTHADGGLVRILDERSQDFLLISSQGFDRQMTEYLYRVDASSNVPCGLALRNGKRTFVDFDVPESDDPDGAMRRHFEAGYRSAQCTLLLSRTGKPLGMVTIHWRSCHRLTDCEVRSLDLLARQAADLIEQQQTTAALSERNQELDSFVYIVSHDLKAPLRAISNLSNWIEEDLGTELPVDTQQQMAQLRGRVQRMEAMINGLLQYARVGRTDDQLQLVSVAELLAEILDSLAPPSTFKIVITPDLPTFHTKRLLLSQVFANLIGNAFKHHDKSNGFMRISCQERGDFYEFTIVDDGPGIPQEQHDRVFIIFQSTNPQKNPDSTGIGLSIVKKIVETAGGRIWLESELGKGTTFYFTWPK